MCGPDTGGGGEFGTVAFGTVTVGAVTSGARITAGALRSSLGARVGGIVCGRDAAPGPSPGDGASGVPLAGGPAETGRATGGGPADGALGGTGCEGPIPGLVFMGARGSCRSPPISAQAYLISRRGKKRRSG